MNPYVFILGPIIRMHPFMKIYTYGGGICFVRGGVWAGSDLELVGSVWYYFY